MTFGCQVSLYWEKSDQTMFVECSAHRADKNRHIPLTITTATIN